MEWIDLLRYFFLEISVVSAIAALLLARFVRKP